MNSDEQIKLCEVGSGCRDEGSRDGRQISSNAQSAGGLAYLA